MENRLRILAQLDQLDRGKLDRNHQEPLLSSFVKKVNTIPKTNLSQSSFQVTLFQISKHLIIQKLVGGLEHGFYFSILIGNVILPVDEVIYFSEE